MCLFPTELVSHPDPACLDLQPSNKASVGKLLPPSESMEATLTTLGKPGRLAREMHQELC